MRTNQALRLATLETGQVNAGATFNAVSTDTATNKTQGSQDGRWSKFRAGVFADQAGTLLVQQSRDGVTWRTSLSQAVTASTYTIIESLVTRRFVRAAFNNTSGSNTTTFELDSALLEI